MDDNNNTFYAIIARYYDSEHADKAEDFNFYADHADEFATADDDTLPILIIGAGTGRVMLALAEQGYTVHGIEVVDAMIERAKHKLDDFPARERLTFHVGDALSIPLAVKFGLIIIPYNTLMHFQTQDAHQRLLARCREWLADGGALIIDLPNAGEAFAGADSDALTLERSFTDIDTGDTVMQFSTSQLDRAEQIMQVTWVYDRLDPEGVVHRTVAPMQIRYFFMPEMRLLLRAAGFSAWRAWGDFDYTPFEDGAPRMIVVAQ